jgi:hypothetical protein
MNDLLELALKAHRGMDRSSGPELNGPTAVLIQIPDVVVS